MEYNFLIYLGLNIGYVVVLLIMNLYLIVDIVNLWSVDFLICLSLNISL